MKKRKAEVNWQFTTEDARIKLNRLYPTLDMCTTLVDVEPGVLDDSA